MDSPKRIGYRSTALFVGMRKRRSGELVEVYVDPGRLEEVRRVRRRLLPLMGMAGVAGITRRDLGSLVDKYGRLLDSNPISRINFLKIAAAGSLTACGGEGSGITDFPDDDNPPTDPVAPVPVISGPSEVSIRRFAGDVLISLDGSSTQGRVTGYEWSGKILNTEFESEIPLGNEVAASYVCSRPGTMVFELTASFLGVHATATLEVTVHPADLPKERYDLPMVFMVSEEVAGKKVPAIFAADTKSWYATRLFGTERIHNSRVNWEPSGEKLVLSMEVGNPRALHTYSLLTGEFQRITQNRRGLAWQGSVSPKGEWVAYIDDSRAPNRSFDEGALVRLDGSDQFYLCGENVNYWFAGQSPSWDKDGERIALGGVRYDLTGSHDQGWGWDRRIGIIGDLWSGSPSRDDYIPSEEQLESFWAAGGYHLTREEFFQTLHLGLNGLAWSPDGLRVVYDMLFGLSPNHQVLALSNVDGSGSIQNLARSSGDMGKAGLFLPNSPTWSADGKTIFFTAFNFFERGLYRIDPETKNMSQVLSAISGYNSSVYD